MQIQQTKTPTRQLTTTYQYCTVDALTGKSYEHRRLWIQDCLLALADIAAYAIMSNHYHLVLHIDEDTANNWSAAQVIEQWQRLFNGSVLSQRYSQQENQSCRT